MADVYVPGAAEGFELWHPEREEDFEAINVTMDGTPRYGAWRSPRMRLLREDERNKLATSDSP
jgi:hypothetical protein